MPDADTTVFMLPGDCFALADYGAFAASLRRRSVTVHVLDYLGAALTRADSRRVTHADCVTAAEAMIRLAYASARLPDRSRCVLLGHSRGAYVAVGILGRSSFDGVTVLDAPYIGPAFSTKAPIRLALGLGARAVLGLPLRLSYRQFAKRFFPAGADEAVVRVMYERARPLASGLLLDPTPMDLSPLGRSRVAVNLYAEDVTTSVQLIVRTLERVREGNPQLTIGRYPGAHGELLLEPDLAAMRVVKEAEA